MFRHSKLSAELLAALHSAYCSVTLAPGVRLEVTHAALEAAACNLLTLGALNIICLPLMGSHHAASCQPDLMCHWCCRYGPAGGGGFLRLHSTYRHDLKIYSSDEGRVQVRLGLVDVCNAVADSYGCM